MSLLLLVVAFIFTGTNQIAGKALVEMGLGEHVAVYLIGFWGSGIFLALAVRGVTKHGSDRQDVTTGVVMGVFGAVMMIFLILALKGIDGVVAFPVRSCGNIALTAGISYFVWRERLTPRQWLGIACAVAAIYLIV